jgi:cobyrinic acid a,c-diamide synthase
MSGIILTGVRPSSGVSLIHLSLCLVFQKKRRSVSPVASSLAQASLLSRITRRFCPNIDPDILSLQQIKDSLARAKIGADIVTIEIPKYSDAIALSEEIGAPVIAIVDEKLIISEPEITNFILSRGAQGIIINRATKSYSGVLGAIPKLSSKIELPSEEIASFDFVNKPISRSGLVELTDLADKHLNVSEIESLGQELKVGTTPTPEMRKVRIAYADDGCFCFGFKENLDLLRFYGAELVSFSPLSDSSLPDKISGLYFPGSNLIEYAEHLSLNKSILSSIYNFYRDGGVIFAEGSSTAYLCESYSLVPREGGFPGARVLAGNAQFQPGFVERQEYKCVEESVFFEVGSLVRGIVNHTWQLSHLGGIWSLLEGEASDGRIIVEGFSSAPSVLCTFGFLNFASNLSIPKRFIDACLLRR